MLETGSTYPLSRTCEDISDTTAICTFQLVVDTGGREPGQAAREIDNGHAGTWWLSVTAVPRDTDWYGGVPQDAVTEHNLARVTIKRESRLSADANPEVVSPGRSVSVIGWLEFADWHSGGYIGEPGRPVRLVFRAEGSPTYRYLDDLTTFSDGLAIGIAEAVEDGWWFLAYSGSATTSWVYSPADYINVR
ncbi:hypothetical protein L0U85_17485 [Glycomyces sp. L485]|uniref:hypothetical protein n=1 Tax=Glycomyces sp. L485 TaxID=2909235 RepID=UPI001F4B04C5|nr:hypothetical protein [Glycomyces sp. L485]MCH7232629.1 hypothetical protein [Glycomyces sp. L485]